jgi:outer membrane protein OmpA-like peptidoglycan-associated protein
VKTGDYPLVQRLFLYTPADSQSSGAVKKFVTFAVSDEGQKVVRESGFVGLDITAGVGEDIAAMQLSRIRMAVRNTRSFKTLKKFVETTEGATRLSVTFRFYKNSARLNNQTLRDIQRLIAYMNGPKGSGKQLMLLGFSADDGDFNRNFKLSWGRAQTVADELVRHGVDIAVIRGFGNDASVACSERRRNTNRRVEVWVK